VTTEGSDLLQMILIGESSPVKIPKS